MSLAPLLEVTFAKGLNPLVVALMNRFLLYTLFVPTRFTSSSTVRETFNNHCLIKSDSQKN